MNFDVADPVSGQPLEDYLTVEYFKKLNAAVRLALSGKNISGGPGATTTQFGSKTTIKAARRVGGGGGGPPVTETITLSAGTGENAGYWVDEDGNRVDCIELDLCDGDVEKKIRIIGWIIEPPEE